MDRTQLPENWRVGARGASWTPPGNTRTPHQDVAGKVAVYGEDMDPGDMSSHLLREGRPTQSRIDWLRRWTDAGRLHLRGWTIRSVRGVYEHGE